MKKLCRNQLILLSINILENTFTISIKILLSDKNNREVMDLKKYILLLMVFFLIGTMSASIIKGEESNLTIKNQVTILKKFNSTIEKWNVFTVGEGKAFNSYSKMVNEVKKMSTNYKMDEWVIKDQEKDHHITVLGKRVFNNSLYKIQLFGYKKGERFIIREMRELSGTDWKVENVTLIYKLFSGSLNEMYSNVMGEVNVKDQNIIKLSKEIMKEVEGKKKNESREKNFISILGDTTKWNNYINTKEGAFNFQLGIRQGSRGVTHVTLGSPLITIEY
jgi:TATA-box binding